MTDKEKLAALERFIKSEYVHKNGAKTSLHSQGSGDDQFSDGEDHGRCWALYDVAVIIEMSVSTPNEQVYDY